MQTFKDRNGKSWLLEITLGAAMRVNREIGLNLYTLIDNNQDGLMKLLGDPLQLADVLWIIVRPTAEANGITQDCFFESLLGDTLEKAQDAFVEAYCDFFPDRGVAETLRKVIAKTRALMATAQKRAHKAIESLDLDSLAEKLKSSPGEPPGPPASTPAT